MRRKILPILVAMAMVLTGFAVFPMSASAAIITVNPGESIQDAIDAASPGDTIVVTAGTYVEQLEINKDLTLKGQSGAVIVPPDTRTTYTFAESGSTWDPVIIVYGGTKDGSNHISGTGTVNVNIQGFEIDGQNKAVSSRFVGILYRNVVGTIKNNHLHNLFDSDEHGDGPETFGICVYGDSDVTIIDNVIEDFSRGGIGVNGDNGDAPDPVGKICYNTVYGNGNEDPLTGWWAENGIQIGWGATGEICGNTVTDCQVNNPDWSASGILVFGSGAPVTIYDNIVRRCDLGIGIGGDWGSGPTDDTIVEGNTLEDNEDGISVQGNARNTLIEGNEIRNNNDDGIEVIEILGYEPLGTVVHCNNIYGNGDYGLLNEVSSEVDAEDNWWGDASGPTHSGNPDGSGDEVSDNVDYEPWGTHINPCQPWDDENVLPDVTTQVTIAGSGGSGSDNNDPPIVKCKWEYDLTPLDLADGGHEGIVPDGYFVHDADPLTPGLQVAPTLGGNVTVGYYAVVTDPNGISTVSAVYADVWHPDGQFKYQIELHPVGFDGDVYDKSIALALWSHVTSEHHDLITYHCEYDDDEIYDELNEELAYIYYGEAEINYCQPGGWYYVGVRAHDTFIAWSDYLFNRFWYIPTAAIEIDFSTIDYGSVVISHTQWVGGDQDMGTPDKPTVRNIGNTPVKLAVWQDDMQFGETNGEWNVWYDARLSADGEVITYDPEEVTDGYLGKLIPGVLDLCTQEKLDFSIHVKKGYPPYTYTGTLRLYAYINDGTLYPWETPEPGTPPLYVEGWYQDTGGPWPPEDPR